MIAFILNINDDQQPALQLVKQVRRFFDQTVIVLGNGVPIIQELNTIAKTHSFDACDNRHDGFWSHRYLTLALQTSASTIIRMDPDFCIKRKFVPPKADWFGSASIEGFSRSAAERMIRSGLLLGRSTTSCQKQIMKRVMGKLEVQLLQWHP